MTTRTFKFYAKSYGTEPAQINVSKDGNPLFLGQLVPTETTFLNPSDPGQPNIEFVELFQFDAEIGTAVHSDISINVTGSDVLIGSVAANNCFVPNPAVTSLPAYNAELNNLDQVATENGLTPYIRTPLEWILLNDIDPKVNVKIDNVIQVPQRDKATPPLAGHWHWLAPAGSTLSFEFKFDNL